MAEDVTTFLTLSSSKSDWPSKDKSMNLMTCFGIGLTQALCSWRLMMFWRSLELWPYMVMAIPVLYKQQFCETLLWLTVCYISSNVQGPGGEWSPPQFLRFTLLLYSGNYFVSDICIWLLLHDTNWLALHLHAWLCMYTFNVLNSCIFLLNYCKNIVHALYIFSLASHLHPSPPFLQTYLHPWSVSIVSDWIWYMDR